MRVWGLGLRVLRELGLGLGFGVCGFSIYGLYKSLGSSAQEVSISDLLAASTLHAIHRWFMSMMTWELQEKRAWTVGFLT